MQKREQKDTPYEFLKMLRKLKKDFETDVLPEIRKREYYLTKSQKRRVKDKKAESRRKKLAQDKGRKRLGKSKNKSNYKQDNRTLESGADQTTI